MNQNLLDHIAKSPLHGKPQIKTKSKADIVLAKMFDRKEEPEAKAEDPRVGE